MEKQRYFYHEDEERIYSLTELKELYNKLVTSGEINAEEESFEYYIDVCSDKNGALTEIDSMEKWKVFRLNGKELCAYIIYGTFDGEEQATLELLAAENNCKISDITVTIEEKTEEEKEISSVMKQYDDGCKKWDKIFKDLKAEK